MAMHCSNKLKIFSYDTTIACIMLFSIGGAKNSNMASIALSITIRLCFFFFSLALSWLKVTQRNHGYIKVKE